MKTPIFGILMMFAASTANADYLQCKNREVEVTEIGVYNNYGKITFQLSAPYGQDYLYVLGHCYSKNEIGMPYDCEAAAGDHSEAVGLTLTADADGRQTANLTLQFEDGTKTSEQIVCEHFE